MEKWQQLKKNPQTFFLPWTGVSGVAIPTEDLKRNFNATPFQEKQYIWMIKYA